MENQNGYTELAGRWIALMGPEVPRAILVAAVVGYEGCRDSLRRVGVWL